MTFAFGIGGPLANFAGLLHMTMHSLIKSAIFFAVGHIAQVKGTQRIAEIRGLSVSHPLLALGLALGVIAIAGLPPFGMFTSEFMLVSSSFAREPWLAVALVFGLIVAFGALVLRMQGLLFGEPSGEIEKRVRATTIPLFLHILLALIAGFWLPEPVVRWFRDVAAVLG
jgi:hydrogenase-4 component F